MRTALQRGYNVEIDVWLKKNEWFLGHSVPQYKIELTFLLNNFLWCHAKNIEAFKAMLGRGIHCFWHQKDDVTLTSNGYIWTYPGKQLTTKSICVLPESVDYKNINCAGICSDVIDRYK